ncbi:MAG: cobalt-precorrin-5B (C(1))-methyltransferase CbiD [Thermoleophilia bacterium]
MIKDAGDDPDVTDGLAIGAQVRETPGRFEIEAGAGVGTVTSPGLSVAPGSPAVNPVPREAILRELKAGAPGGATVTILAPGGEELARKTLNPRLGIVGGISILGTTGRVEPWSVEAMRESLVPQLDVARARGRRSLVFVLGAKGRRLAEAAGFDSEAIVETGNELGWMLEQAVARGFESVTVRGHVGKLAKLAAGIYDTHSREADARLVTLAAFAGACGVPAEGVRRILRMATAEEAAAFLVELGAGDALEEVAREAAVRARERYELDVRVVILNWEGAVLADSGFEAGPPREADLGSTADSGSPS